MDYRAEIIDEEAYSDDDEVGNDDPWIQSSMVTPAPLPKSLHLLRVATSGNFSDMLQRRVDVEIQARGGILVQTVTRDTSVLLAPHVFARSKKAYAARKLGIPIMDEATFLRMPLDKSNSNEW